MSCGTQRLLQIHALVSHVTSLVIFTFFLIMDMCTDNNIILVTYNNHIMNKLYPLTLLNCRYDSHMYKKKSLSLCDNSKSTEIPCHIIVLMAS
jgi:hypothetical protein